MKVFNPVEERGLLERSTGYRRLLAKTFEFVASDNNLTNWAEAHLNEAITCLLVGFDGPARQLLARAREWLISAIQQEEIPNGYAKYFTEGRRHLNLALCNWLLFSQSDRENYHLFVQNDLQALRGSAEIARDKTNISLLLPNYVDAGAYREALELFSGAKLKPAASLAQIRTEGQMCYVLCRHLLGEEYSAAEVAAGLRRFLDRAVNHWLLDGHWDRAAEWMKIVHWNGREHELTAVQALLKCYDYLKNPIPIGPDNVP